MLVYVAYAKHTRWRKVAADLSGAWGHREAPGTREGAWMDSRKARRRILHLLGLGGFLDQCVDLGAGL